MAVSWGTACPKHPEPLRSEPHRRFIAGLPCIACAIERFPFKLHETIYAMDMNNGAVLSQCAHFRWLAPHWELAVSRKVGDNWTAPMCPDHHRQHDDHPEGASGFWREVLGDVCTGLWRDGPK